MSKINIQDECMKIHHKYGTSERANYEIQLLCQAYADQNSSKAEEIVDNLITILKSLQSKGDHRVDVSSVLAIIKTLKQS